jgi:hypothetical protein
LIPIVLASTIGFVALHLGLWKWREADFNRAFRMSRGFAAVVLTVLGLAGLVDAADLYKTGFLTRHDPGGWMLSAICVAYGHLIADCLSMLYGRIALGIIPRNDLIAHHALALLAYGISMAIGVGHALVLVTLASEAMPCCSGLEAWGKHLSSDKMVRAGSKGRLAILLFWRLPLWALVMTMLIRTAVAGEIPEGLTLVWIFASTALVPLICLDIYWVRKCAAQERIGGC